MNPCYFFGEDESSTPHVIKKDTSQTLKNGDIFGFQTSQYRYQVFIDTEGTDENNKTVDDSKASLDSTIEAPVNGSKKGIKKPDEDENTKDTDVSEKKDLANKEDENGKADASKKKGRKPAASKPVVEKKKVESDDEDDEVDEEEEEEEESESEEEAVPKGRSRGRPATNSKGRPKRAPKQATAKSAVSLDDYVASDDEDLWKSESEDDFKPKKKRRGGSSSESGSDWEMDHKKPGRGRAAKKNYAESESDSDSDWGKKKKVCIRLFISSRD